MNSAILPISTGRGAASAWQWIALVSGSCHCFQRSGEKALPQRRFTSDHLPLQK
jgi:hypothetical protein